MTTTTISSLTERLPLELLEKVLSHTPVRDIPRMKRVRRLHHQRIQRFQLKCLLCQINRFFNNLIQASPYINYRLDLFDAGLNDNPAINLSLTEKRRILDEYRTKWDTLSFIKKQKQDIGGLARYARQASGSGIFGFVTTGLAQRSIQFMTLESVSRGIPQKEWGVLLPPISLPECFAVCPQVDVLAILSWDME